MRDWWLRTLLVLQRPRAVFVALRDEDREVVAERAEPVLLIIWLAGIAAILADATTYLDDATRDGVDLALWVFAAGGLSGAFAYFLVGWFLHRVVKWLGSHGTYRRSRHVLAFAAVPVALSLVLWPFKLALCGEDWFRTGGSDTGAATVAFDVLAAGFCAWSIALLVIGVRSVHGWTWRRSLAATTIAIAVPAAIALLLGLL
jgi:hypothetical protein